MAIVCSIPFLTFHAILLHADVNWTFGPLRRVVAGPASHRWHHSADAAAQGKNFAGPFPAWDLLFGTVYMPDGRSPDAFGAPSENVPELFWGQMAFPLGKRPAE